MPTSLLPPSVQAAVDPRRAAFADPAGPDVFGGVVHGSQLWAADPFDVPEVHSEARSAFARLLGRAAAPEPPPHGKTLLLLGDAGSGKTHLMRAFRHTAHADGSGYCGYLQMRTRTENYARYLLSNLLTSLDQPYKPGSPLTGMYRLARGLLDALDMIPATDRQQLYDDELGPDQITALVRRFAEMAVQYPRFQAVQDEDVLRAVLYCLSNDGRVRSRAIKWLRCEDLSEYDRRMIGDMAPRPHAHMPMETVLALGRLMRAAQGAALVLLVDQIDEALNFDRTDEDPGEQFRAALAALTELTDRLPTAVLVIGCLDNMYAKGKERLPSWLIDRLTAERPLTLAARPSAPELLAILGRRLAHLLDATGREPDPADPLAPFVPADLLALGGLPTRRAVLECVHRHQMACIAAGRWLPLSPANPDAPSLKSQHAECDWERRWNEFHSGYKPTLLDDEPKLAKLLVFAVRSASAEMPGGAHFAAEADGRFVQVEAHTADNAVDKLLLAVCDKPNRGTALKNQVMEVERRAGDIPAVLIRSTDFPRDKGVVAPVVKRLVVPTGLGRTAVVADGDWRSLAAFRDFHIKHHAEPGFADWQRAERPLSELPAVHAILALDKLPVARPTLPMPPPPLVRLPAEAAEVVAATHRRSFRRVRTPSASASPVVPRRSRSC